jgi:hypothetical protein
MLKIVSLNLVCALRLLPTYILPHFDRTTSHSQSETEYEVRRTGYSVYEKDRSCYVFIHARAAESKTRPGMLVAH